jgi:hypothetical protein
LGCREELEPRKKERNEGKRFEGWGVRVGEKGKYRVPAPFRPGRKRSAQHGCKGLLLGGLEAAVCGRWMRAGDVVDWAGGSTAGVMTALAWRLNRLPMLSMTDWLRQG